MKRQNVYVTDKQADWLKIRAEKIGISVSELIRRILSEKIDENARQIRKRNPN